MILCIDEVSIRLLFAHYACRLLATPVSTNQSRALSLVVNSFWDQIYGVLWSSVACYPNCEGYYNDTLIRIQFALSAL